MSGDGKGKGKRWGKGIAKALLRGLYYTTWVPVYKPGSADFEVFLCSFKLAGNCSINWRSDIQPSHCSIACGEDFFHMTAMQALAALRCLRREFLYHFIDIGVSVTDRQQGYS